MVKKVAYCIYAHKSNVDALCKYLDKWQRVWLYQVLLDYISIRNDYAIVKYDMQTNAVSLIASEDWDTAHEPTVGDSLCVKVDKTTKTIKGGTKVYHNKWQFVDEDTYTGFDIQEAKCRTQLWNSIPGIAQLKNRIGSKAFWHELLKANNIEV